MRYRYEGHNQHGQVKRGHIEADDPGNASELLRKMQIYALKVEPDGPQAMKTVLPGGEPLPETKRDVEYDNQIPADIGDEPAKPCDSWHQDLRKRIRLIGTVCNFARHEMADDVKLDPSSFVAGVQAAEVELVKQAVMKALKDAM